MLYCFSVYKKRYVEVDPFGIFLFNEVMKHLILIRLYTSILFEATNMNIIRNMLLIMFKRFL